jgi:hypothetical protein
MSETPEAPEVYLTERGTVTITIGTTFSHGGQSHWPKVSIEDGPDVALDENGNPTFENSDSMIYRVSETVHYVLAQVIARMKSDIDKRNAEDQARRQRNNNA